MFYTPFSSNAQTPHEQRIIPTSCTIPPESLKMQEDDASNGGILFVYRGLGLFLGSFVKIGF